MNPHKLIIQLCLCSIIAALCSGSSFGQSSFAQARKPPTGGRLAVVVDERLAALRSTPQLSGRLVRRLGRGRMVAIRASRATPEGVVFYLVNVTSRTHGWLQREAVASATRPDDDRRLLNLIKVSDGFDRIVRARIFLDHFARSPLRPQVLLLLSSAAEEQAAKLSRDAAQRLNGVLREPLNATQGDAPEFSYFMNYSGLDRYNRQRVSFVFDPTTKRFHYDGAALRELIRRYPNSPEAGEARKRLANLGKICGLTDRR